MRVGVFDSGVGGLTVVKSLLEHRLFEEIIYYGDTARVPYGVKDKNTIVRYSLEALEFFKNFDIDILITACNSVSAYALDELKANTDIPVIGVIEPGVLALVRKVKKKDAKILIIGTKATVNSKKYENSLLDLGYENLNSIPTSLFVPIVEEGIFRGEVLDSSMRYYFKDLKRVDAVILGCTHFPLIEGEISAYLDNCLTIHSGEAIVEYLKKSKQIDLKFSKKSNEKRKSDVKFFASENPENLKRVARNWLGSLLDE